MNYQIVTGGNVALEVASNMRECLAFRLFLLICSYDMRTTLLVGMIICRLFLSRVWD